MDVLAVGFKGWGGATGMECGGSTRLWTGWLDDYIEGVKLDLPGDLAVALALNCGRKCSSWLSITKAIGKTEPKIGEPLEDFWTEILGHLGSNPDYQQLFQQALIDRDYTRTAREVERMV